ncbi:DNA-binding protein [Pedobacter lusitanus]|uniref:DNA-binding protein n=1 Tax=Pedobacter lusitanus TaxID=1503925 RepID=A0A0D0GHE2_9SPHI|nr:DNA-binding protein [Pedobacter lusitanus]
MPVEYFCFFFSALGVFNGLILSGYFLFFTGKKQLSNLFFGALLLAMSLRIGKSIMVSFNHSLPKIYLQIGLTACFFIGPFLYYFLKTTNNQATSLPKSSRWSIAMLFAVVLIPGILFPYQTYPKLWNNYFVQIIYAEWFVYLVASGFVIKGLLKNCFHKEYKLKTAEIWILTVFGGSVLIFMFFQLALWNASFSLYLNGAIAFSFSLYLAIFTLLYRKRNKDLFASGQDKYPNKKVKDDEANILLPRLEKIMIEKELYKNPDLKLNDLSKDITISSHQLSQLLNDNLGKNFTTYVNEFRINEACRIMTSDNRLTLESIGYEVGFNSKSTFFATFKKLTGTTPAAYQQKKNVIHSTDL